MKKIQGFAWSVSEKSRRKRAEIFRQRFVIDKTTKLLDIGSESGENINLVLSGTDILPENVYIADIDNAALEKGCERFGYQPVFLDQSGSLSFPENFFDIVYCSSVIEHATIRKERIWNVLSEKEFQTESLKNQKKLAGEINRIGKQYFVQTPAKYFPLESHTGLPFFAFLSRSAQIKIMKVTNKFWIKEAHPDFNLLTKKQMQQFFPEAEIILEKKFGMIKSIMAIKSLR
ncbi:MAG: methyltransferase domain-containing protein [Pyrinomonadaceae bacterium]